MGSNDVKYAFAAICSRFHKYSTVLLAIFSDVILVSNYYGCKGEAINLILHCMVDIIYKIVNPSHLEKL